MNTIGMHLVKTQTVGTGVSSVAVTGAFSADYQKYLVTLSGGTASTTCILGLQLGSTVSAYNGTLIYAAYGATAVSVVSTATGTTFVYSGIGYTDGAHLTLEIQNPFLTQPTFVRSIWSSKVEAGSYGGVMNNTTSYTGFTITPSGGATLTGGTINVYGYRNS
jgi:hypothetical protein